ncbi:MAG: alkaline phosphatase family protein [Armatimonadetes bacterium]|nr:alkaline phosphatase family protein [Armatimonadota bacterium]
MTPPEYSMTCVGPTVAEVLGLPPPAQATGEPIAEIVADLAGAERLAIVAPDALGLYSFRHFTDDMPFLRSLCDERMVVLRSVMPSITPVNFATMVTGCDLDGHGVRSKELDFQCETLFDVLAAHGRTGAGCGRPGYTGSELLARVAQIDGTAELSDDAAIEEVVLRIAREARPDFIIAQIGGTDDHFHRFGPRGEGARPKVRETDARLQRMCGELGGRGYAVMILADHGQHETDNPEKMGGHGTDSDEDCLVPCTRLKT